MAREQYLLHAGEETINRSGAELKPENPKSKWDNFWFYHKWHVILGVAAVLLAGFFIHDMLSVVHPDYEIGMITRKGWSESAITALENDFQAHGEDLNGDGKVVVQVNSYVIAADSDTADPNVQMASVTKLTADLSRGTSVIFLTDDPSFQSEQMQGTVFSYLDGSNPPENAADYNRMRVALKNCKKLQNLTAVPNGEGQNLLDSLSLSLRVYKGSSLEGKADKQAYYAASKKLFDKVIAD